MDVAITLSLRVAWRLRPIRRWPGFLSETGHVRNFDVLPVASPSNRFRKILGGAAPCQVSCGFGGCCCWPRLRGSPWGLEFWRRRQLSHRNGGMPRAVDLGWVWQQSKPFYRGAPLRRLVDQSLLVDPISVSLSRGNARAARKLRHDLAGECDLPPALQDTRGCLPVFASRMPA